MVRISLFLFATLIFWASADRPAAGDESRARLASYNLPQPAKLDREANCVELPGKGVFSIHCDPPAATLAAVVEATGNSAQLWIEGGDSDSSESVVRNGKPAKLQVAFDPPATLVKIAVSPLGPDASGTLRDGWLTLTDGHKVSLASLFVDGHEKLGPPPPLSQHVYPEPATRALSAEAAEAAILADWRAQRGRASLREACRDEIVRTARLVDRQASRLSAEAVGRFRSRIDRLSFAAGAGAAEKSESLYREIRRLKREIMLGDPAIDFTGLLCIDNPYTNGSEAWHQVRARNEDTAVPGGRLLVVEGLRPDAPVRKLAPHASPASFWRPDLSFDGQEVLYSMKPADGRAFHIYKIGLDGCGRRQLTSGDYNDLDPIYIPDGGMVFTTTRINQFLRCGGSLIRNFTLARADRDGKNIYFISTNNEADHLPSLLPDGRILYCRWEYVDREIFNLQGLWTVNPDGTSLNAFWGNQSRWPDMVMDAHPIPGTEKLLFNAVAHHCIYDGGLGILDPREGTNYPDGLYNLTPHIGWPEIGRGPADRVFNPDFQPPVCYKSFLCPRPVSADLFLASARKGKTSGLQRDPDPQWFQLYLMDYDGNMELLFKGEYNVLYAQPLRARSRPNAIPSHVAWPGKMHAADQQAKPAVFYSDDVYQGSGISRGTVKSLRIMEIENATFQDGDRSCAREMAAWLQRKGIEGRYFLTGETVMSLVYDEGPKRVLGTVPVEPDGSVNFQVPPLRSLYFQLLDDRGRCLQTMRSLTHAMPGETRGCLGCHETRLVAPRMGKGDAFRRPPSAIAQPPWGDATISFPRFVQPVLDKHCVSCHNAGQSDGGIDLAHRAEADTLVSWPYVTLIWGKSPKSPDQFPLTSIAGPLWPYHTYANDAWSLPTRDTVPPPMTAMSYNSRLLELATSEKHYGVRVSPLDEAKLAAWVDALCPYLGLEEIIEQPDPDPKRFARLNYAPRMRTAPIVHRAFQQDAFATQDDRIPKDAAGNALPSVVVEGTKRLYRLPLPKGQPSPTPVKP